MKINWGLIFLGVVAFLVSLGLILMLNYRQLIFPSPHRNQLSPRTYVAEQGKLLPEAASTALVVVEHGPRTKRQIALTFDADMTPEMRFMLDRGLVKSWYNRAIKETLDQDQVKATVFLGGLWTKTYPKEAKQLAEDPLLEIGNHSYNHYAFSTACFGLPFLGEPKETDDVAAAQKIITATTGVAPKYFRFPGGCYERISLRSVVGLGLSIIHWDVAAGDGFNKNTDLIVRNVENRVQNGSIVAFHLHDGGYAPKTNDALKRIIPDLRKRGFEFVKVSELLAR